MIGVYKILNTKNNRFYIGSSIDIKRRWKEEKRNPEGQLNKKICNDIKEYGIDSFEFIILEKIAEDNNNILLKLNILEKEYIKKFKVETPGLLYNIQAGGNNRDIENRKKLSLKLKGRKLSPEHREKVIKAFDFKNLTSEQIALANENRKKKVLCIDTCVVYSSIKEAAIKNNIQRTAITKCCKGKQKTCGGLRWKYC
jgi:group I intron endonuclease